MKAQNFGSHRGRLSNFSDFVGEEADEVRQPRGVRLQLGLELDVTPSLQSMLLQLDQELTPFRLVAERLADSDSLIDMVTGAALISHLPQVGTEAFACVIFPGIGEEQVTCYEKLHSLGGDDRFAIPSAYRNIIRRMNGAQLFNLTLYGLPPSMCRIPPLLNRAERQPLDLGTANRLWRTKYSSDPALFHFGGGPYSANENIGYFLKSDGGVVALLKGGQRESEWLSIEKFLSQELSRVEKQS